jgi:hypothetical protein
MALLSSFIYFLLRKTLRWGLKRDVFKLVYAPMDQYLVGFDL